MLKTEAIHNKNCVIISMLYLVPSKLMMLWLASLTTGKLDLKGKGIETVKGLTKCTISDGTRTKTIHVN